MEDFDSKFRRVAENIADAIRGAAGVQGRGGPDYYGRVQMAEAARAFRKAREERKAKRKAEEEAARKEAGVNG